MSSWHEENRSLMVEHILLNPRDPGSPPTHPRQIWGKCSHTVCMYVCMYVCNIFQTNHAAGCRKMSINKLNINAWDKRPIIIMFKKKKTQVINTGQYKNTVKLIKVNVSNFENPTPTPLVQTHRLHSLCSIFCSERLAAYHTQLPAKLSLFSLVHVVESLLSF